MFLSPICSSQSITTKHSPFSAVTESTAGADTLLMRMKIVAASCSAPSLFAPNKLTSHGARRAMAAESTQPSNSASCTTRAPTCRPAFSPLSAFAAATIGVAAFAKKLHVENNKPNSEADTPTVASGMAVGSCCVRKKEVHLIMCYRLQFSAPT